jgi:8-hydroxy-5-deazaflavin:NADPH oxidoreductase
MIDRYCKSRFRLAALAALLSTLWSLPQDALAQSKAPAAMKVGIIGSGNIGGTVGALWVKAGHQVLFSSRNPESLKKMVDDLGPQARAGTVAEALAFGDAILIAVPYAAYPQIGKNYSKELAGKIVLDAGNAVPSRDGAIANEVREIGIGTASAKYLPKARVVRAFNTINYQVLAQNAHRSGERMAIPIAGDDKDAIATASRLVRDAGFEPVLVGSLESAKLFAQGGPLYGQQITAQEMQSRLKTLR